MIEPLQLAGDVRDGAEIAKINEIIDKMNKQPLSSHPQYVKVEQNEGGFVFDFTGLVTAIAEKVGGPI